MSAAFNKIKKVDRSKLEGNALKAYDTLKEETDNFDKDVAVALNLDDDVERLAKKLEEKFPESVGKKKAKKAKPKAKKKAAAKKKSAPKEGSGNKGSFAKLRASIAKREGISYKAALPIAKKEYAEQKKKDSDSKKEKRSKRMEAFKRKYKGRGTRNTDVQKDSKIPAKAVGKRVSKTGNTYYEYRDNRTDQRQPQPTNEPRLDVGGMIKREYDVNINSGVGTYAKGGEIKVGNVSFIPSSQTDFNIVVPEGKFRLIRGGAFKSPTEIYGGKLTNYKNVKVEDSDIVKKYSNEIQQYLNEENDLVLAKGGYIIRGYDKNNKPDAFVRSAETRKEAENKAKEYKKQEGISRVVIEEEFAKGGKTDETFIQDAVKEMEKKGTIGSFTKKAEKRGMTPIEFASEVLDSTNKNKFTEKTRKQAQFVKNANPELFAFGGEIVRDYDVNINSGVGTYAQGGEVKDINKFKKQLIAKAKRKGIYENFGQSEVRKLETKYGYTNNVREFDNWAMNFDLSQMAKGGMIRIESGNKGKTKVVYNKKKDDFTELQANEIYDNEKAKGKSVFLFVNDELFDSHITDDDNDMYAKGGDILKAGDTDCPDELLNYAVGGRLNETMQGLKKGDTLKIKFGSAVSKDNVVTLRVKSRNKVRKGTIDKITFENLSNPKGVKFFAYDRGDGFSFAMGDLGISNIEILNKYKEGGKTQGYNAQLDESLGDRTGREELFEQKRKDRRDESKAMEEAMGRRAYASVRAMDKKKRRK